MLHAWYESLLFISLTTPIMGVMYCNSSKSPSAWYVLRRSASQLLLTYTMQPPGSGTRVYTCIFQVDPEINKNWSDHGPTRFDHVTGRVWVKNFYSRLKNSRSNPKLTHANSNPTWLEHAIGRAWVKFFDPTTRASPTKPDKLSCLNKRPAFLFGFF